MRTSRQLHALAATARIANMPSVACNLWLGIALGSLATGAPADGQFWRQAALLGVSGASLYLAGNFFNDWADRGWDARHRPERALPQGVFTPGCYLSVALLCCLLGLAAAAATRGTCLIGALCITMCIASYTRFHKRTAWAVIPLGLCRALLPGLGFIGVLAMGIPQVGPPPHPTGAPTLAVMAAACGLFCHIVGLSLSARNESLDGPPERAMSVVRLWFLAAAAWVFCASCLCLSLPLVTCVLGLLPYGLWVLFSLTVFRRPASAHVASLLAGIPLVDWGVLLPLSQARNAHGLPEVLTAICLLLPPLAFLLGRLLQRLAPAT
jgi:hypothetical protein